MAPDTTPLLTTRDLVTALAARGGHPALLAVRGGGGEATSHATLGRDALALAGALAARGVGTGERVILFGAPGPGWITVRLALGALGAVTVAFDETTSDAELAVLVPASGARLGFVDATFAPRLAAVDATLVLATLEAAEGLAHWHDWAGEPGAPLPPIAPDEPTMLVTTSGTTGRPKAFLLTHANILHNVRTIAAQGIVTPADRALLPLPLHHVYPLTVGVLTPLAIGATVVLPEGVTGPLLVAALKAGQCTVMVAVPRLYAALLAGLMGRVAAQPLPKRLIFNALFSLSLFLRRRFGIRIGKRVFGSIHRSLAPDLWLMASGGAAFDAATIWPLEALGWQVLSGWGLAETASILTNNHKDRARIGAEGFPLPGVTLRVFEPNDKGVGELQAKGPSVFAGYLDNPEANATAFTEDGWYRSGDLGFVDGDGYVHIVGRVKEMIVLGGGKNIFPEELEKTFAADPAIAEIGLVEKAGSLVGLVVPDEAAIAASGTPRIEDAVRVALTATAQGLPSWQRLSGFAITREKLPRTRLGKIQRFLLPRLYEEAAAGRAPASAALTDEDRALIATPPADALWALLRERFPGRVVSPAQSPQLDLGLDSLGLLSLAMEIEARLGIALGEEELGTVGTLADLLRLVIDRPAAAPAVQAPPDLGWLDPPGPWPRLAGRVLAVVNRALMALMFRLRTEGRANIPDGPVIIAANHLSDIDPTIVGAALPPSALARIRWAGDRGRLFGSKAGRFLARAARIFPVDERAPGTTLAYARAALERGDCLVWFPESWRSPDGRLQTFMPGIGELVRATGAPVVPARITGTFEAMPRTARFPKPHPVRVVFGPAIPAATLTEGAADAAEVARRLRAAVAALEGA
ncbi:AMP-binding protein [Elioraea sp.]|uniref:AMP-binding protein n=1 Tax=Elioraea sp. TaxID=2185103 RepID=UPI0025B9E168|nr:AMP-binding protein [Elioraea sp.]